MVEAGQDHRRAPSENSASPASCALTSRSRSPCTVTASTPQRAPSTAATRAGQCNHASRYDRPSSYASATTRSRLLKFNDHSVNLSLADVLSAVRHGLTPKYVASLALKHAYRPVGVSVLHTIVSQGVENVLRMSVHPFACARLQPQFQYAHSIVLKPNGQPLR